MKYVLMTFYKHPYLFVFGAESFMIRQAKAFNDKGIDVVITFPIYKSFGPFSLSGWAILYNGKLACVRNVEGVKQYIADLNEKMTCEGVFVHTFWETKLNELYDIISFRKEAVVYIHDFASCCKNHNLTKNDEYYCGSGIVCEDKCHDCKYYEAGKKVQEDAIKFLKGDVSLKIIFPSENTKKIWIEAYPFVSESKHELCVVGHHSILSECEGELVQKDYSKRKIRVAFIGNGTVIKGWKKWIEAVDAIQKTPAADRYEFYHLGNAPENREYIKFIPVSVKEDKDAMIHAMQEHDIDVVLLFSGWPETYSYTYYESVAADKFVITSEYSGNIKEQVEARKNGVVLPYDSEVLLEYLKDTDNVEKDLQTYYSSPRTLPKEMVENKSYLEWLHAEDDCSYTNLKKGRRQLLLEALYRFRYRRDEI